MKICIRVPTILLAALLCSAAGARGQAQQAEPAFRWFKGNTHTHTMNSDGDSPAFEVALWYREQGYNFVFITDHEFITQVAPINELIGKAGSFLVFSGQEVTDHHDRKPYHINGLGLNTVVMPARLPGAVLTLQKNIDAVRAIGGLPQLNHPNFGWALSFREIRQLRNLGLMEIFSGHPLVNNLGGGGSPSVEQIWDELLTDGQIVYGVASDDSHSFKAPWNRSLATPGHGWVMVRASELSTAAIVASLERGDFYSSTGVELEDYTANRNSISLKIKAERWSRYRVVFIGARGRILRETDENPAIYQFTGNEQYVRAKIYESNGKLAWTQPVFRSR